MRDSYEFVIIGVGAAAFAAATKAEKLGIDTATVNAGHPAQTRGGARLGGWLRGLGLL